MSGRSSINPHQPRSTVAKFGAVRIGFGSVGEIGKSKICIWFGGSYCVIFFFIYKFTLELNQCDNIYADWIPLLSGGVWRI